VKVDAPKIVNVSAGVAVGLLIQRMPPVYPQIARTARVSGTVVLQATISKSGAIEGLHVVSGPDMLRQAALDAVRTWRYKPFMLNNEPVAVETTVNVIFAL
jgi:protein TonB